MHAYYILFFMYKTRTSMLICRATKISRNVKEKVKLYHTARV